MRISKANRILLLAFLGILSVCSFFYICIFEYTQNAPLKNSYLATAIALIIIAAVGYMGLNYGASKWVSKLWLWLHLWVLVLLMAIKVIAWIIYHLNLQSHFIEVDLLAYYIKKLFVSPLPFLVICLICSRLFPGTNTKN